MSILSETIKAKPAIFVASSSEGLDIARAIKSQLDNVADVDLWNEDLFTTNQSFLSDLLNLASFYDFAIMVFSPDDKTTMRGRAKEVPRDNVVFEMGLFLGRLGPSRAFIVCDESIEMFSDYQGITVAKYEPRSNLVASVGDACMKIRTDIKAYTKHYRFDLLPSTALAIGYYTNFLEKVIDALLEEKPLTVIQQEGGSKNEQRLTYGNHKPRIKILFPTSLSDLTPLTLKSRTRELRKVNIETSFRPFPFYLIQDLNDVDSDFLDLIDIPTTLHTSQDVINRIFQPQFLEKHDRRARIEQREITNFEKTLRMLIPDSIEDKTVIIEKLDDYFS